MSDPVWLPEVLRAEGLTCREYPGWRDRGHGDFGGIWGVIVHHTGSFGETPRGIAQHPELGLASQLHLSAAGEYTVCGAGIAWHAGNGSWPGLPAGDANRFTIGIEAANDGGGAPGRPHRYGWSDAQYFAYVRGVAAILRHLGLDASRVIGHKEWAGPAQGKWDPGAIDMRIFRSDVQAALTNPTTGDDIMASLNDDEKKRLLDAADRVNGVVLSRTPLPRIHPSATPHGSAGVADANDVKALSDKLDAVLAALNTQAAK